MTHHVPELFYESSAGNVMSDNGDEERDETKSTEAVSDVTSYSTV